MKHVKLTVNLGIGDAKNLGLGEDPSKVRAGAVVAVTTEAADILVERAWGVVIDAPAPKPAPKSDAKPQGK